MAIMSGTPGVLLLLLLLLLVVMVGAENNVTAQLREECSGEVDRLGDCIAYTTEKVDEPTQGCCREVDGLRSSKPRCLCYVILKANCGQQVVFSMALNVKRLVGLAKACGLNGTTDAGLCPSLLGLPPGSPDRAIFNGTDPQRQSTTCERSSALSARFSNGRRFALAASSAIFSSIFAF